MNPMWIGDQSKSPSRRGKNKKKPKTKIKKRVLFQYDKSDLKAALDAINKGKPISEASREFKVPKSTLFNKSRGIVPIDRKMGPQSTFTPEEEDILVLWIKNSAAKGFPVSKEVFLHSVGKLAKELNKSFKKGIPGRKWFKLFLKRHPDISIRTSQNLTASRANVTPKNIEAWFEEIHSYLVKHGFDKVLKDPDRIFNTDESAFFLNPKGDLVLAKRGEKNIYNKIASNEKECLTVLVTGNAGGTLAPPMVIFQYQRIPSEISNSVPPEWGIGCSDSGWNNCEVMYCYMTNIFYPWAKKHFQFPILFFLDGHISHLSYHLSKFCEEKQIILVALYPNSTQFLQPMDVSVFRTLKTGWKEKVHEWRINNQETVLRKPNFAPLLNVALKERVTEKVLRNGFRKCGLYPWDPSVVPEFFRHQRTEDLSESSTEIVNKIFDEHLKVIEKYIPVEKRNQFEKQKNGEWSGAIEDLSLFQIWNSVKQKTSVRNSARSCEKVNANKNSEPVSRVNGESSSLDIDSSLESQPTSGSLQNESIVSSSAQVQSGEDQRPEKGNEANLPLTSNQEKRKPYENLPSPFKNVLQWPRTPKRKVSKRNKDKIPSVISSQQWQEIHENKKELKRKAEEEKLRKKAEREAKKKKKEEEQKKKKENAKKKRNSKRIKKVSISESEVSNSDISLHSEVETFCSEEDSDFIEPEPVQSSSKPKPPPRRSQRKR